jgi:hypothetical protein
MRHSSSVNLRPSRPKNDQMYTRTLRARNSSLVQQNSDGRSSVIPETHPSPTAEMKVPANANVRMTPKLRKKFS